MWPVFALVFPEVKCTEILQFLQSFRSSHVIFLLPIIESVVPSCPLTLNCDSWSYFSLEENVGFVFHGVAMYRFHSLCVVCVHTMCECLSYFDIIIVISNCITTVVIYKVYMYMPDLSVRALRRILWHPIYLRQCTNLNDHMPHRHQVWAFCFSCVSNIYIIVNLYDLFLLPIYFCYITVNVRNLDSPM